MAVPLPVIGEDPWGDDLNAALTYVDDQTIAEIDRATQAEEDLEAAIAAVPGVGAITGEVTRATAAEATLTTAVSAETAARIAADTTNADAITAETTARTTAVGTNSAAIAQEVTDRAAAITTEASDRTTADTTNANAITAEATARAAAVAAATVAAVAKAGDTMTGALTLSGNPGAALEAATKQYVDAFASGTIIHAAVRAATTANGTLATAYENGDTIDGVVLATGDRILIKDQSAGAENGVYTVNASGAPTRAAAEDSTGELGAGARFFVTSGTVNGGSAWVQSVATPTIGTTALIFVQSSGATSVTGGTGITVVGNSVSVNTATVVDKTTAQTLTNKTLTAPVLTAPTGIVKADVGLSNVDNTSNATERAAAATLTNKTLTSPVLNTGVSGSAVDVDSTMAANSDTRIASQKAVKTALATKVGADNPSFTTGITTPKVAVTGITGATSPTRIVGGTLTGKPTTGTFAVNDIVPVANGTAYICTVAGTFGVGAGPTFVEVGATLAAFALSSAASYTDGQLATIPSLISSDPSIIAFSPPVGGVVTMDLAGLKPTVPIVARLVANAAPLASNTTVTQVVSGLVVALAANTVYKIEAVISYRASAAADLRLDWSGSFVDGVPVTGPLTYQGGFWTPGALSTVAQTVPSEGAITRAQKTWLATGAAGGIGVTVGTHDMVAHIVGILHVGATGGDLQLRAAQNTATAEATPPLLLKNSTIIATQISP